MPHKLWLIPLNPRCFVLQLIRIGSATVFARSLIYDIHRIGRTPSDGQRARQAKIMKHQGPQINIPELRQRRTHQERYR